MCIHKSECIELYTKICVSIKIFFKKGYNKILSKPQSIYISQKPINQIGRKLIRYIRSEVHKMLNQVERQRTTECLGIKDINFLKEHMRLEKLSYYGVNSMNSASRLLRSTTCCVT